MKILAIANAFPKFKEDYSGNYIYKQLESLSLKGVEWLVEIAEQGCNKSKEFGCDKNVEGLLEIIKNSCATEIR